MNITLLEVKIPKIEEGEEIKAYGYFIKCEKRNGKCSYQIEGVPENWLAEIDEEDNYLVLRIAPDINWWNNFHIDYLLNANFSERLVVFADGSISIMPRNTWFQETPDDIIGIFVAPGEPNVDTTEYVDGVGIYNEETGEYEWDLDFCEIVPEYCRENPKPTYRDILIASIEAGDWSDFYETLGSTNTVGEDWG